MNDINLTKLQKEKLQEINITSPLELIEIYPYRYDEKILLPIEKWTINDKVFCFGEVIRIVKNYSKNRLRITSFYLNYQEEMILVTMFNQRIYPSFIGKKIAIFGKWDGMNVIASQIDYNFNESKLGISPVYRKQKRMTSKSFEQLIKKIIDQNYFPTIIPEEYCEKYHLISRNDAIKNIHFPKNKRWLEASEKHLKYEEFLFFQLSNQYLQRLSTTKNPKKINTSALRTFIKNIPFTLSKDQIKSVEELKNDFENNKVMYRLLQGDVGSGKTIVGIIAMWMNVVSGFQSVLLAPTIILAKQHYENLGKYVEKDQIVFLHGGLSKKEYDEIINKIYTKQALYIVATHAIISEQIKIPNLGFVIIDEQQRFGVNQRKELLEKGANVDVLLMSATPIPRTLVQSLYFGMDLSTIGPHHKKVVHSYYVYGNSVRDKIKDISILQFITKKLKDKQQCYIVCPAIDKNTTSTRNVQEVYSSFCKVFVTKYKIGLLHGQHKDEEKTEIMRQFKNGEIDVLVTTSIIEIGIDVANANVMLIYEAHRFGLSQLHQLRGRLGRGKDQGHCIFLSNSEDELAIERLKQCVATNDGMEIALADLKLRGTGDLLGVQQSGSLNFKIANIVKDYKILDVCQKDAKEILDNLSKHNQIQQYLIERFGVHQQRD